MKNIDIEIYKSRLVEATDFEMMSKEFQVDKMKLKEVFSENLDIIIEENYIDDEDPTLDEEQYGELIMQSVTRIHLDELIEKGLLQADLDIESGENVYKLTEEGKSIAENL
jgi:hypothetical protein